VGNVTSPLASSTSAIGFGVSPPCASSGCVTKSAVTFAPSAVQRTF